MPRESAIVLVVPEVEPIVAPVRRWYDPSAAQGVPAHITLLYPWHEPPLMGADLQAPGLLAALPVEVRVQHVSVLESRDDGQWIVAARIPLTSS